MIPILICDIILGTIIELLLCELIKADKTME